MTFGNVAWVFAGLALASGADPSDMIGTVVPPYPKSFDSLSGTCIAQGGEICAFSISTLNAADGAVVGVLAKKLVGRVDGRPRWRVLDVRALPPVAEDEIWTAEDCYRRGMPDPSLGGIVRFRRTPYGIEAERTVWAVTFDLRNGKLGEIDPSEVECVLPGS